MCMYVFVLKSRNKYKIETHTRPHHIGYWGSGNLENKNKDINKITITLKNKDRRKSWSFLRHTCKGSRKDCEKILKIKLCNYYCKKSQLETSGNSIIVRMILQFERSYQLGN